MGETAFLAKGAERLSDRPGEAYLPAFEALGASLGDWLRANA